MMHDGNSISSSAAATVRGARARAALLILGALAFGCDDPLLRAQDVEGVRVLGARVEVSGDPERAAPRPGEAVSVRWLVVAPGSDPVLGWTFSACAAAPTSAGTVQCRGDELASASNPAPSVGAPELDFTVPEDLDASASATLAVLGAICADTIPHGSADQAECARPASGRVMLEFPLANEADVNHNPSFADSGILFDGAPWAEASPEMDACADGDAPRVRADALKHVIDLIARDDARDPLPQEIASDPARESLEFGHFSTLGALDRPFSVVAADAPDARVSVDWKAPSASANAPATAKFWFVLRDLRGGAEYVERRLCVLP